MNKTQALAAYIAAVVDYYRAGGINLGIEETEDYLNRSGELWLEYLRLGGTIDEGKAAYEGHALPHKPKSQY